MLQQFKTLEKAKEVSEQHAGSYWIPCNDDNIEDTVYLIGRWNLECGVEEILNINGAWTPY